MKQTAKVDWFCPKLGYGYLKNPEGDQGIWVHFSDIRPGEEGYKSLERDQLVEYTPADGEKGPKAVEVFPVVSVPDGINEFLEAFDDDALPDGAWWARLEEGVAAYNEEHDTTLDLNETVHAYVDSKEEVVA